MALTEEQRKWALIAGVVVAVLVGVWLLFRSGQSMLSKAAPDMTGIIAKSGERVPTQDPGDGTPVGNCPPFGFNRDPFLSAANAAGLDASLLSFCNGAWYYNGIYTCVSGDGTGTKDFGADVCPDTGVICAPELLPHEPTCTGSAAFRSDGALNCKMKAIASIINSGIDASCTLMVDI